MQIDSINSEILNQPFPARDCKAPGQLPHPIFVAPKVMRFIGNCKLLLSNLLKYDLPRVKPLEVHNSQDKVEEGGDDDEDRQLPGQPGQQVEGLVLFFKRPDVVQEGQVLLPHF